MAVTVATFLALALSHGKHPKPNLWIDAAFAAGVGAATFVSEIAESRLFGLLATLLLVATFRVRLRQSKSIRMGAALLATCHCIHLTAQSLLLLICVILSISLLRRAAPPPLRTRPIFVASLVGLGLLGVGWSVFGWTFFDLEWSFLYTWFPKHWVELYAPWFFPVILLRYGIPFFLVLLAIEEQASAATTNTAFSVVGVFVCTSLAMGIGAHAVLPDSFRYLENLVHASIALALGFGAVLFSWIPTPAAQNQ